MVINAKIRSPNKIMITDKIMLNKEAIRVKKQNKIGEAIQQNKNILAFLPLSFSSQFMNAGSMFILSFIRIYLY